MCPQRQLMTKPAPAVPPVELNCADEGVAREMRRWLSHLRSERRLSPKTLEAYARDVRQCLGFLGEHWGAQVTLSHLAALKVADARASMASRRPHVTGALSLMRGLAVF